MAVHPRAGRAAEQRDLVDVPSLIRAYYTGCPDPEAPEHHVAFGTSGHRDARLGAVREADLRIGELAGEPVESALTRALGNGEPIGGVKVASKHGWFAARPSGTEPLIKIYAESFLGPDHLERIQAGAQEFLEALLA